MGLLRAAASSSFSAPRGTRLQALAQAVVPVRLASFRFVRFVSLLRFARFVLLRFVSFRSVVCLSSFWLRLASFRLVLLTRGLCIFFYLGFSCFTAHGVYMLEFVKRCPPSPALSQPIWVPVANCWARAVCLCLGYVVLPLQHVLYHLS